MPIIRPKPALKYLAYFGKRSGKLVNVGLIWPLGGAGAYFFCKCDCGKQLNVYAPIFLNGQMPSCGCSCLKPRQKHKLVNCPEYSVWSGMKQRCHNPLSGSYKDYGGRGIFVCDRWYYSFENFYEDMGPRPSQKHSIDRIDNNRGYEPENCRWATSLEQGSNKRHRKYLIHGDLLTITQIHRNYRVTPETFKRRINKGLSPIQAVYATNSKSGQEKND